MKRIFRIRDDRHCDYSGNFATFELAYFHLKELAHIPFDVEPN